MSSKIGSESPVRIIAESSTLTVANSYHLIGLKSCLLKTMNMVIEMRIRAWVEFVNVLPDSQNGFREGYRTNNNTFVLWYCIDNARAQGKALYVAFIRVFHSQDFGRILTWFWVWFSSRFWPQKSGSKSDFQKCESSPDPAFASPKFAFHIWFWSLHYVILYTPLPPYVLATFK